MSASGAATQVEAARSSDEPLEGVFFVPVDPDDVVPILNRAGDMGPLAVVLALVPVLVAWQHASLTWADGLWCLKAWRVWQGAGWGHAASVPLFPDAAPLGTWLHSLVFALPEPLRLRCLLVPAWAAAFCFVCAAYLLVRTTLGPRAALLCAALLSFHAVTFWTAQDASPLSWSLPAALLAFWAATRSLQQADRPAHWLLLTLAACAAACVLAGGAVAVAVLAVVALWCGLEVFGRPGGWGRGSSGRRSEPGGHGTGAGDGAAVLATHVGPARNAPRGTGNGERRSLAWRQRTGRSLWVLVATVAGGAVGVGVWFAWAAHVGRSVELSSLLVSGLRPAGSRELAGGELTVAARLALTLVGPLAGLVLLGVVRAVTPWVAGRGNGAPGEPHRADGAGSRGAAWLETSGQASGPRNSDGAVWSGRAVVRGVAAFRGTDFVLLWLVVGLVFLVALEAAGDLTPAWADLWERFLLVPVVALAAHGLNALLHQRFTLRTTLLVVVLTVVVAAVDELRRAALAARSPAHLWWWVVLVAAASVVLLRVEASCRGSRRRTRWCVGASVLAVLFVHAAVGLSASRRPLPAAGRQVEAVAARLWGWGEQQTGGSGQGEGSEGEAAGGGRSGLPTEAARAVRSRRGVSGVRLSAALKLAERVRALERVSSVTLVGPAELVVPLAVVVQMSRPSTVCRAARTLAVGGVESAGSGGVEGREGAATREAEGEATLVVTVGRLTSGQQLRKLADVLEAFPTGPAVRVDGQWAQLWLLRWSEPASGPSGAER